MKHHRICGKCTYQTPGFFVDVPSSEGGWVAPNIFYLGDAGVFVYKGIRIAGLSGIYKQQDHCRGHFEIPPFSEQTIRSVYHVRHLEVYRLAQLQQPIDIFVSHDWPLHAAMCGNVDAVRHLILLLNPHQVFHPASSYQAVLS